MGREDWWYINLPVEMADTFEKIIEKEGKKYAIYDKKELVRQILRDWLIKYEEQHGIVATRKAVRRTDGTEGRAAL